MERIRIAQIGIGHDHAGEVLRSIRQQSDIFEVVGYALPEIERTKFRDRLSWLNGLPELTVEEILSDPTIEAVTVETEEVNLTNYALPAARAGKHMHMDKPGGLELSTFEELVETVREKKLAFSLGYMYRHNPAVMELMEDIRSGKLGEIYSVEAHMNCWHPTEKRQWLETFPGGMMFFLGCHLIDLIYRIMGEPEEVIPMNCCTGIDGVTAEDFGMAVLRYKNGVAFAKTCDVERGGFERRQLVVTGSKGTVELRPLEAYGNFVGQYTGVRVSTSTVWADPGYRTTSRPEDRYDRMLRVFAGITRGELESPYSYDYELGLYKLVLRACGVKGV